MTDKLRDAAQQALEALINARDTTDSDTLFVEFDANITALRAALAQQDAQAVPLTEKQRVYLAQAWAMLEDYAADQRQAGNDSIADGADASAHEIKLMLNAAPTPPAQQDAQAVYQYQKSDGSWIDQTESSYQYNAKNGATNLRVLYAAPTPPAQPCDMGEMCLDCQLRGSQGQCPDAPQAAQRVGLTDDEIDAIGNSEWGGYPSYDREFKRILRAVIEAYERKNGIK